MRLFEMKLVQISRMDVRYSLYKRVTLCGKSFYSIKVENQKETAWLSDVTVSFRKAKELYEMLVRGGVTPVTAYDVWEDWGNQ